MDYLEYTGDLLLEGEDHELLQDCLRAYVFGLFASSIVTADALIERLLTDFLESRGLSKAAKASLGKKIDALEDTNLIDSNVLGRISRLHRVRNNLAHEHGPDDPFRLFRRSLAEQMHPQRIMAMDAREAVMLAYGIAARIKRRFPRLATD